MHRSSAFLFLLVFCIPLLTAQAIAGTDIEDVVVTATRTPELREQTGESISVLTGAELQTLQTTALTDALSLTPGLSVNRNGEIGQLTTVEIRGAESGQTLVLIDGVRINDPSSTDEGAILADLLVNNIDRVEILRGPQSTLYGSDAIGGVVNILTRRGGGEPVEFRASAEAGSFDTYHINTAANGTAGDVEYGAAANYFHTNGVSAADRRAGNTETDGYGNLGATANMRVHLSDTVSIDARGYYTDARTDFDDNETVFVPPFPVSDSAAYNTDRLFAGYTGVNVDLFGGMFHNRFAMMGSKSDRNFYDSAFDIIHRNFAYKGDALRFEYQGIVDLSPSDEISFGAETQRISFTADAFSSCSVCASAASGHSQINGYYAQWQSTFFDALTLTGGVRYDHDAEFGNHTSLKLAGAWRVADGTTLRANYGDGFKAPSLYELFSAYSSVRGPLKPETAKGWEAGADQNLFDNRLRASLTYFERRTIDLIDFTDCATASECAARPFGFYYNVGRTRSDGVEAQFDAAISDAFDISANYTNAVSRDLVTGRSLHRRPHIEANTVVTWKPLPGLSMGTSFAYVGKRIDQYNDFATPPVPLFNNAYTLANLFAEYDLGQWAIYGRVENLFDEYYRPELGYGAPGRAFYIGIRAND